MARPRLPVSVRNLMQRYHRGERDFSGIRLPDAVFGPVHLEGVNFADADLSHVMFGEADLEGICFDNAKLTALQGYDVDMQNCSLKDADLSFAEVSWSSWRDNDFTGAKLTNAFFTEMAFDRSNFTGASFYRTGLIGCDIRALCRSSSTLIHTGPSYIDPETIIKSIKAPNLKDFMLRAGVPPIFVDYMIESALAMDNPAFSVMHSTFISYGSPDGGFARQLYEALHANGVKTFFFPEHAVPGKRLHRLMREGVNQHDRVVLICSEASLNRTGVLNEIEETLAREARDGGETYLIPIRLDDYIFNDWAPAREDLAQALRDRVVADFSGALEDSNIFKAGLLRLLSALRR
jgi:hypothetical protein